MTKKSFIAFEFLLFAHIYRHINVIK